MPAGVVPLYDWGCTMWSMIDCRDPDGPMWSNADGDCWPQGVNLAQWLVAAMDGELRFAWPNGVPPESEWHRPNASAARREGN
ncbi:hypothetical protein [Kitasatospora sp. MBT63]|uniref:hypothetical protein n=1 Tax=Kitasatospora sp. MBT63 TaxID=1444768 RepID=UPI0011EA69A0|nr:hypothetical protein [Kitasatospora sp. MBT63]